MKVKKIMSKNRIKLHQFWGEKSLERKAKVYLVKEVIAAGTSWASDDYEVDFYKNDKVVETRKMISDGVVHSESYAEDAAENWCLGVMEIK